MSKWGTLRKILANNRQFVVGHFAVVPFVNLGQHHNIREGPVQQISLLYLLCLSIELNKLQMQNTANLGQYHILEEQHFKS